jgi:hypothetical protein
MVKPAKDSAVIVMVSEEFWHCGFLLRLPVMSGSTQFVIQQFLPEIGSEIQGPRM